MKSNKLIYISTLAMAFFFSMAGTYYLNRVDPVILVRAVLIGSSVFLTIQGIITLSWMLYAWENPAKSLSSKIPSKFSFPYYSFTAILPLRNEKEVVLDTLKALNSIDYPNNLKEVIVVVRHDDKETIKSASDAISQIGNDNISLQVLGETYPINKPFSLNMGIKNSNNQIVGIFDAEDEPSKDIYNIVNTTFIKDRVDVVQSGVQLMNYNSNWFSTLNVLEYFLWFKSGMHFFTDVGKVSFLGGNTVFFKKSYLNAIDGWDHEMLTEDADLGIRLTLAGAATKVIYDENHVTMEETPSTLEGFIKQRTRWNHGFLQIISKGDWMSLPSIKQKFISLYVLMAPFFPLMMIFYIPFGLFAGLFFPSSVALAMLTYLPFYILLMIICTQIISLWEFTRAYKLKFNWYLPFKLIITYFPYTMILTYSAMRSVSRYFSGITVWEKTAHLNLHRS